MGARRFPGLVALVAMAAGLVGFEVATGNETQSTGVLRAGVASVDLSWNVGRNQGQLGPAGNAATGDQYDPFVHTSTQQPTQGIQARLTTRALVVEGADGTRVAYLKNDHYLQQDLLFRRVAQLVEDANVGISRETLMIGATHNHSAPYGATTSWGVWVFADAFDAREFDYFARGMADAVIQAAGDLRPVQVGASVGLLSEVQQNILGPTTADDGTPAGFPRDHFDPELAVIRFDDISDPAGPRPYAALVNLGMHPESLAGNGFTSPDFVGVVEHLVDRATGATTVWSQGGLGDVEPDRGARANPPEARAEFWRRDYAQQERMSRVVADRVVATWADVAVGDNAKHVPFSTDIAVDMISIRFPGPASHPVPTVSNCRTDKAAEGTIGVPVAGFPDCARQDIGPDARFAYDALRDAGVPVTENYGSAPGWTGAQETLHAHLQVMRLGDIVLATCPCEPVTDMTVNFKTRTDATEPEMHLGWVPTCSEKAGDPETYECEFPGRAWQPPAVRDVPRDKHDRMMAQILNDAAGWDAEDPESILRAESESVDPDEIKGNFTHERIQDLDCGEVKCAGYALPLMVGTANDYIGYIVTYREYMRGDHYRKALTPFGPHSADYVNTRLVRMAAALQGADDLADELLSASVILEEAVFEARARSLGEVAAATRAAYEAILPDDGGTPAIVAEPADVERFDAAQVRWIGGSTYSDDPRPRIERLDGDEWVPVADQHGGEVVVTVEYRRFSDPEAHLAFLTGDLAWLWTATWEAFDETEPGTYRFVVEGTQRVGGAPQAYTLTSEAFDVSASSALAAEPSASLTATIDAQNDAADLREEFFPLLVGDDARFRLYYPDSYTPAGVPYISDRYERLEGEFYCLRCTFRAWRLEMTAGDVTVTVRHDGGGTTAYAAAFDGTHWVASGLVLGAGDEVWIEAGDAIDDQGNINGEALRLA